MRCGEWCGPGGERVWGSVGASGMHGKLTLVLPRIPISTSDCSFGWLLKRREAAVFSSARPQEIHVGIHRPAA